MAKHSLNKSNIDAGLNQQGSRRMPEHVRGNPSREPHLAFRMTPELGSYRLGFHHRTTTIKKQSCTGIVRFPSASDEFA
jgi:hypothetical protein